MRLMKNIPKSNKVIFYDDVDAHKYDIHGKMMAALYEEFKAIFNASPNKIFVYCESYMEKQHMYLALDLECGIRFKIRLRSPVTLIITTIKHKFENWDHLISLCDDNLYIVDSRNEDNKRRYRVHDKRLELE